MRKHSEAEGKLERYFFTSELLCSDSGTCPTFTQRSGLSCFNIFRPNTGDRKRGLGPTRSLNLVVCFVLFFFPTPVQRLHADANLTPSLSKLLTGKWREVRMRERLQKIHESPFPCD